MPLLPPGGIGDFRVKRTKLAASATAAVAAQQSPTRIAVLFSAPAGPASVDTNPGMISGEGISIANNLLPFELDWQFVGSLVNQAWYYVSAANPIFVYEVFYEPQPKPLMERANGDTTQTVSSDVSPHRKSP